MVTATFRREAERALGSREEPTLFGFIQYVSGDYTRATKDLSEQARRQRVAGELMSLMS
jgi:hypothetical protein